MRFLADVGISRTVVHELRKLGHEAIHLSEERLECLPDDDVIIKARNEDRIILTHDLDFTRIMAIGDISEPSAITFRLSNMRPTNVLAHLLPALNQFSVELQDGALVTLTDTAGRCRILPIRRTDA